MLKPLKINSSIVFTIVAIWVPLCMMSSCRKHYTPKPRGYFRIDLPVKKYRQSNFSCPFSFEYPEYAQILPDKLNNAEPYWMNIDFPSLHGKIHISYKVIHGNLSELTEDSRSLAYKHTIKADAIEETPYADPPHHMYGLLYDIKGNAASSVQFFLTDSTRHFVRGALYFYTHPNADSLSPVISFVREDILHMMSTFRWKE